MKVIKSDKNKLNDPNHKGDINELKASTWLMEKGYEVFKNLGCTGRVDLVVRNPETNEITQVQVKTVRYNTEKKSLVFRYSNQDDDYKLGIKVIWVLNNSVGWNRDFFDEEMELSILRNEKYGEKKYDVKSIISQKEIPLSDQDMKDLYLRYV